jgi:glucokinase
MLLAGDIGGTKTALGIFSEQKGPHTPLADAEVHSADYPSLEVIAREFIAKTGLKVDSACFLVGRRLRICPGSSIRRRWQGSSISTPCIC